MHSAKISFLKLLILIVKAMDFLAVTVVLTLVGMPLLDRFFPPRPGETYAFAALAERYLFPPLEPLAAAVRRYLPHAYQGQDVTPFVIAGILVLFCLACTAVLRQLRVDVLALENEQELSEAEAAARQVNAADRIAALSTAESSRREQVLELYAQTKKLLDEQKRDLAFLAIDVVDSTGMKQGEDPALAERDFRQYRKLVEAVIGKRQALKAAWTPDGVMICLPTLEAAVGAGQDLIRALHEFNQSVKTMKAAFKVRCGVNAGSVLFDDSMRMEEMSDAVIDLAGHMQKYAAPDAIFVSQALLGAAALPWGFKPSGKKVDGIDAAEWRAS